MPIKNERIYGDVGPLGAVWFDLFDTQSGDIPKDEWDAMRPGMACLTSDAFGDIKSEIEKLCSVTKCSYDMTVAIARISAQLARIQPVK